MQQMSSAPLMATERYSRYRLYHPIRKLERSKIFDGTIGK